MTNSVYCLASAKGGSGKTILCASFAAFLAQLGKRVLIIDADAATYGLTLFYLNEVNSHRQELSSGKGGQSPRGVYDTGEFSWERDVVQLPNGVSLVPATFSFSIKETSLEADLQTTLKALLSSAKEQFDYVFLDTQAGSGSYSRVAMSKDLSDEVVIVSEYDPLSAAGVDRLKAIFRDDLLYARTWVLLNKILPEFAASFSDFFEVSKYLTPIPWDADVVRAYARRRLPLDLGHGNQFTLAVMQNLKKLLGTGLASEIDGWAKSRASSIREPIEEQYQDAEQELGGLLKQKVLFDREVSFRRLNRIFSVVVLPAVLTLAFFLSDGFGLLHGMLTVFTKALITPIVMMVLALGALFLYRTKFWYRSAEREMEESRFIRQIIIIEDKLKKLEVLRNADLETLVKRSPK